jgi:hypothetical protein
MRVMRTGVDRFAPPPDIDEGWRDIVSSAPPPPPPLPADVSVRINVPANVTTTDRQGCVTRVQFGAPIVVPEPETPSFEPGDRRMWIVAGCLMGLATLVLLVLGFLTYRSAEVTAQSQPVVAPAPALPVKSAPPASAAVVTEPAGVGSARPLIAQHALRHSNTKHGRKHKKVTITER